jgi:hypothetical protein
MGDASANHLPARPLISLAEHAPHAMSERSERIAWLHSSERRAETWSAATLQRAPEHSQ